MSLYDLLLSSRRKQDDLKITIALPSLENSDELVDVIYSSDRTVELNPSKSAHKKKDSPALQSNVLRHIVKGYGRIAFGPDEGIRNIYKPELTRKSKENDVSSIVFSGLNLSESRPEQIGNCMDISEPLDGNENKKDFISNNSSTASLKSGTTVGKRSISATINDKAKPPSNAVNNPYINAKKPLNSVNSSKDTYSTSIATRTSIPGLPPRTDVSNQGKRAEQRNDIQVQAVGVGTSGRAAAMAKMKALGQDWPEEEELPGYGVISSSSANINNDIRNEINKSTQRQRKVKTARSK